MRFISTLAVAGVALSLLGCSSSSGDGRECIEVPQGAMERIADGANDNPITPITAAAVKSAERGDMTVIAMTFTDERTPDEVLTGVWGLGGELAADATGPWVAIDSFAQSWTDYPGEVNGEAFDVTEDGVAEANDCLAELTK